MELTVKSSIENKDLARQRLRLWLQMLKATRHVESTLREKLREGYGTTLPRFDVLEALRVHPDGMKMSELSQNLVVSNGNVTGVVDRLVADGLAKRQTLESDRRASLVRITEKGRAEIEMMTQEHLGWIDGLLDQVSESDAARAISIMLDIRHKK
ncbi:MarR family winged helix-turn-helix transcriptional regulator [Celeribacter sp.]|uniref:MarR family winged helix-turn-helix transcriptional regulator n=1 Tax=Celeribacter sp. TaxID=1890673 RepID=UPI003A917A44